MVGTARKVGNQRTSRKDTQRLEARVSAEQKMFFQQAAALRGVSLTDFMIDSMREAAVRTVEEHDLLRLTATERKIFLDVLLNPPPPNEPLRLATNRHTKMVAR